MGLRFVLGVAAVGLAVAEIRVALPRVGKSAPVRLRASDVGRGGGGGGGVRGALDLALRTVFTGLYEGPAPPLARSPTIQSLKFLAAGGIGGIISRTIVSPLEVVATVNMASAGKVEGVLDQLTRIWAQEGLVGFYRGNGANCLKVAPTKGIQFVSFEFFKRLILAYKVWVLRRDGKDASLAGNEPRLEPLDRLIAGGCAGMVAAACVYPLETVKSLLTVERGRYGEGIWDSLSGLCKEQGFFALYRGLLPTLIAMFPYVGVEFCCYESLKTFFVPDRSMTPIETMAIGACSGALAQSSCHPLDVVRKRLQLQGIGDRPKLYRNMIDGLAGISSAEGLRGLYKGLKPACLATLPSTGSSYVVYEAAKSIFGIGST